MSKIRYSISSDQHCHNWSQFARVGADGVNTRLQVILDELVRQAQMTKDAGSSRMFLAGDLFHIRGQVSPEVLNPTMDTFRRICQDMSVDVFCIAGNHDLSTKDATRLGNSMQALHDIEGFEAIVEPQVIDDEVFMVPWVENLDELRALCKSKASDKLDLIIHAPMNGVIKGIPDHGLEADEVAKWGYNRVFCGHYHNRMELRSGVWSCGATTHQTWGDPDTKAGFMMIYDDRVEEIPSEAPSFVNYDGGKIDKSVVGGNYIRMRLKDKTDDEIKLVRADLEEAGALGIVNHSTKKRETTRGVSSPSNVSLDVSVASFVKNNHDSGKLSKKRIAVDALSVLEEARTVTGSED